VEYGNELPKEVALLTNILPVPVLLVLLPPLPVVDPLSLPLASEVSVAVSEPVLEAPVLPDVSPPSPPPVPVSLPLPLAPLALALLPPDVPVVTSPVVPLVSEEVEKEEV